MTPIRATIRPGYRIRLALLAVGLLAWMGWCFYDGLYAYPKQNQQYQQLEAFKETHDDWQTQWVAYAAQNNLPTDYQQLKPREAFDIYTQFIMAAITGPIGLWFAIAWFRSGNRYVELAGDRLKTSAGDDAPLTAVKSIDETRWATKGIAWVSYEHAGKQGRVLLDDWKFEREPTVEIYHAVKKQLDPTYEPTAATPDETPAAEPEAPAPDANPQQTTAV